MYLQIYIVNKENIIYIFPMVSFKENKRMKWNLNRQLNNMQAFLLFFNSFKEILIDFACFSQLHT